MSIESKLSGHWTDEQLIAYIYGVGPEDRHADGCAICQAKLARMNEVREKVGREFSAEESVSSDFLAAQRRSIYARLTAKRPWFAAPALRRWAAATAALVVLGGGLMRYEQQRQMVHETQSKISDAQLALEVSSFSEDPEAHSTAPLQALFEE